MANSAPLRDSVATQMKEAMKGGDKVRVGALRLIMAALKDREIEARGAGKIVSQADELALLTKMMKSRQESAAIYAEAGRKELAEPRERGDRGDRRIPAEADGRSRRHRRRQGRHRLDRRDQHQGHGQGGQRAEGGASGRNGFRQGERDREGPARRLGAAHKVTRANVFKGFSCAFVQLFPARVLRRRGAASTDVRAPTIRGLRDALFAPLLG